MSEPLYLLTMISLALLSIHTLFELIRKAHQVLTDRDHSWSDCTHIQERNCCSGAVSHLGKCPFIMNFKTVLLKTKYPHIITARIVNPLESLEESIMRLDPIEELEFIRYRLGDLREGIPGERAVRTVNGLLSASGIKLSTATLTRIGDFSYQGSFKSYVYEPRTRRV